MTPKEAEALQKVIECHHIDRRPNPDSPGNAICNLCGVGIRQTPVGMTQPEYLGELEDPHT